MLTLFYSKVAIALLGLGAFGTPNLSRDQHAPRQLQSGVGRAVADRARALLWPADDERKELERRSDEGFKRQLAQLGRQFAPPPVPEPVGAPPLTYEGLKQQALDRGRRSLAITQAAIKKIEEEPDPRVRESKATLLKQLKDIEARRLRQLEGLERPVEPYPWMPLARPGDLRPLPPVKD